MPLHSDDLATLGTAAFAAVAAGASWVSVLQTRRERVAAQTPLMSIDVVLPPRSTKVLIQIINHGPAIRGVEFAVAPDNQMTLQEEVIAVMRAVGSGADGARLRALIVILWRAGPRIGEALDLAETDLDASRGAVLVGRGKVGRRREVGMDAGCGRSRSLGWLSVVGSRSAGCCV